MKNQAASIGPTGGVGGQRSLPQQVKPNVWHSITNCSHVQTMSPIPAPPPRSPQGQAEEPVPSPRLPGQRREAPSSPRAPLCPPSPCQLQGGTSRPRNTRPFPRTSAAARGTRSPAPLPRTDGSHICPPTSHGGGAAAKAQDQRPAERAQMRWKGKSRILARSGSCRQIPPSHRAARSGTAGPLGEPSLPRLTAASRAGSAAHPQPEPPRAPGDGAGRRQRRGATGGCTAVTSCRSPPGRDGQVCRLRGQPRPP